MKPMEKRKANDKGKTEVGKEKRCQGRIEREFEARLKELEELERRLKKDIEKAPQETVYFLNARGSAQFYVMEHGRRRYLPVSEREKGLSILQRRYDEHLLKCCQKEHAVIGRFLKEYRPEAINEFIRAIPISRKAFLDLKYISEEQFEAQTAALAEERYKRFENSHPVSDRFVTERGEAVRSKSELIIANMLVRSGLQYYYELPMELSGGSCLFPDFTIVDKDQRRLIYWEHFGMTDEFSYASKMAAKLAVYERNGIFPGDRLIMTMESRDCPLDVGLIRATIRKYLEQ